MAAKYCEAEALIVDLQHKFIIDNEIIVTDVCAHTSFLSTRRLKLCVGYTLFSHFVEDTVFAPQHSEF